MASGYKSNEKKLLAIYRLDFYKKKKNWKLPEDLRKVLTPSPNLTNELNKTYDVGEAEVFPEPEFDKEQASPHNQAFQETDDALDSQPPDVDIETPSLPSPELIISRPHSWAEKIWGEDNKEDCPQDWCGTEAEGVRDELANDECDGFCDQHNLLRPDPVFQLELQPSGDLDRRLEYLTPAQMQQTAGDWLMLHDYPVTQEYADSYEEYGYMDESADFVRGSHYAPHSTEIDLSITQECECTCNNLYGLPMRKLAGAIQRHHSALTRLLREQALRERLSSRSFLPPPLPLEDYPMRNVDQLRPDCVLSGSHCVPSAIGYDADTGRGRGRLQQHRLIGIGMGRPYRL